MAPPILILRDISLTFGGTPLLREACISVSRGERLCLIGRNGSGKSTLLKIAAGLIEGDSGEVFIQPGITIRYLPQEPKLKEFATTGEYVNAGLDSNDDSYRGAHILEQLGLNGCEDTANLSGGQARRAALARVLAPRPDILLLDEPSLGLSPKLVKEIFGILLKLNKDQGVTILLVEQNAKAALDIADFGYVMELGRIVLHGKSSDLRESRDIQEFYLGVNQNSQLDQKRWKNRKTWR